MISFDIETGPLPDKQLPAFDRDSVKLGNLKDPEKIKAKVDEAEATWRDRLALSPLTGRVLAIGYMELGEEPGILVGKDESEKDMLRCFWDLWLKSKHELHVGFNIFGFDLPYLFRRSLLNGVRVPNGAIDRRGYWHESFCDLLNVWRAGNRQEWVSMDALAAAFGLEGKTEGVSGKDFAGLWFRDRPKAIEYLKRDIELPLELAEAMGV